MVDTANLRELMERATKGPWRLGIWNAVPKKHVIDFGEPPTAPFALLSEAAGPYPAHAIIHTDGDRCEVEATAALIVAMHEALPSLLDEIERLRGALEPFARAADKVDAQHEKHGDAGDDADLDFITDLHCGDLRAARTALHATTDATKEIGDHA